MKLRSRTKAAKPDRDEEKLQQISADLVCGPDTVLTLDHSVASMTIGSDEKDAKIKALQYALEKEQRERLELQNA
jgi:hypothetical protein